MNYKIIGKGDNEYEENFENINGVYSFLYKILDKLESNNFNSYPQFDIEDDKITLIDKEGKEFSCNGWHWFEQDDNDLIMPDGETFYSKVSKLN